VTFPVVFDAFEFCTDRLKAELTPFRDADMDKDLPPVVPAKEGAAAEADSGEAAAADDADAALQAALAMSMEVEDVESDAAASAAASATATAAAGLPLPTADFRGQYELFSIVTHKGRSANGGHYIGWAKKAKFSDQWYKFDDDTVR
jgi:ubiquitin carboxyl-terminal hydrolase 14